MTNLESDWDDGSADLLSDHKLFAQHRQNQVFPAPANKINQVWRLEHLELTPDFPDTCQQKVQLQTNFSKKFVS